METDTTEPGKGPRYAFELAVLGTDAPDFAAAAARAHQASYRPRCLCRPGGLPMYVAHLGDGFIVKRMPTTGHLHAPDCGSYEPPPELSGRSEMAAAMREDLATGCTALEVDFALCQRDGLLGSPSPGEPRGSARSAGARLTLRGVLHYLWEQAELHRWHPGFAGRRPWGTVRRHLLRAAQATWLGGQPLASRLYMPEVFSVEQREALARRRRQHWASALPRAGQPQPLLLVLGELKDLAPARYGHKAVLKHLPDQAFWLDAALARRLTRLFDAELALWGANSHLHLVLLATALLSEAGLPSFVEVSLMLTTATWLPADNGHELQLLQALVDAGRRFSKPLRYQLPASARLPTTVLSDTEAPPTPLYVLSDGTADLPMPTDPTAWCWSPQDTSLPALPRCQDAARRMPTLFSPAPMAGGMPPRPPVADSTAHGPFA